MTSISKNGEDAVGADGSAEFGARWREVSHLDPRQVAAWRRMSPTEKWELAQAAQEMAREAVRARIAREHPEYDSEGLKAAVARFFISART